MTGTINIAAVLVANAMGVVLLTVVTASARWRLSEPGAANASLRVLIGLAFLACIADSVASLCDSVPGALAFAGGYIGNLLLHVLVLVIPIVWITFLSTHLSGRIAAREKYLAAIATVIISVILAVNLFVPIAFSIDESNAYHRGPFYIVLAVLQGIVLADSVLMYLRSNKRSAQLRFFPVHYFLVPVLLGILIQTFAFGVSAIWSFTAISVCGVVAGLQNEEVFRDQLTGLFNRTYLDRIVGRQLRGGKASYSGIMLDLNGFKSVNDTYGHAIGDLALKDMAQILTKAVGDRGIAARYAGDEFVVVLATQDEEEVLSFKDTVRQLVDQANTTNERPYRLSASMGSCKMRPGSAGLEESIDLMDALMYDDKRLYYAQNSEH